MSTSRLLDSQLRETLEQGMKILETHLSRASGGTIPGETVFQLYDTYGFPVDLTADIAREHGVEQVDPDWFATEERWRQTCAFIGEGRLVDAKVDCRRAYDLSVVKALRVLP